jgi:sec-independent protein translocase protein TatA
MWQRLIGYRRRNKDMGSLSPAHWIIVALVVLVLFGSGRVSSLMGDLAKGIKTFRKEMASDPSPAVTDATERERASLSFSHKDLVG